MTKKIIALALCVIMLTSMTSCGLLRVNLGGFSLTGLLDDATSKLTAVLYSENYSVNVGMLVYYYNNRHANVYTVDTDSYISEYERDTVIEETVDDRYVVSDTGNTDGNDDKNAYDSVVVNPDGHYNIKDDYVIKHEYQVQDKAELDKYTHLTESSVIPQIMLQSVIDEAREILVYCEASHMYGVYLDDEDQRAIDEELLEYVENTMREASGSVNSAKAEDDFIAVLLAEALTDEADARRAIEYSHLAAKTKERIEERAKYVISEHEIELEYINRGYDENNDRRAKQLCYAYFTEKKLAEKVISDFIYEGKVSRESFIDMAEMFDAKAESIDEYVKGDNYVFDEWLYDSDRRVGDLTPSPIYDADKKEYLVIYYDSEGEWEGKIEIRRELVAQATEEIDRETRDRFSVSTNETMLDVLTEYFI